MHNDHAPALRVVLSRDLRVNLNVDPQAYTPSVALQTVPAQGAGLVPWLLAESSNVLSARATTLQRNTYPARYVALRQP